MLALIRGILEYFPVHTYHIALLYAYAYQLIELRKTYQYFKNTVLGKMHDSKQLFSEQGEF